MRLTDTPTGYGWISIALHWLTAIVVLTLWYIGSSVQTAVTPEHDRLIHLHVSIAGSMYVLLWARVLLRVIWKHPGPLPQQGRRFFAVAKFVHYTLVAAIAVMLISGPLMVWSGGQSIAIFDWLSIPSPFPDSYPVRDALHRIHAGAAYVIIVCFALHLLGVFKHAAFNHDGTFDKMMVASRSADDELPRD